MNVITDEALMTPIKSCRVLQASTAHVILTVCSRCRKDKKASNAYQEMLAITKSHVGQEMVAITGSYVGQEMLTMTTISVDLGHS